MLVVLAGLSYHLVQASYQPVPVVGLLIRRTDLWTKFVRKGAAEAGYESAVLCKWHTVLPILHSQLHFGRLS